MHKISVSPKVFWFSATLWVNAIIWAATWLHDRSTALSQMFPTGPLHTPLVDILTAANVVLRFKTKAPVLSAFVNAISGGKWAAIVLIGCGVLLGSVNANASSPAHFYLVRISTQAPTLAANPPRMSQDDGERFPHPKMQYAFLLGRSDTPISALSTEPFSNNVMPTLPMREKPSWTPLDARDLPTLHVRQGSGNPLTAFLERLSGTLLFDMKTHGQITGAVLSPIERLWQDGKNEFSLDWDAFLGVMGKELAPATGCLLMAKYQPARWGGIFLQGGLGARVIQSGPVSGVAAMGAGYSKRF